MMNPEAGENARSDGSFWAFLQTALRAATKNQGNVMGLESFPVKKAQQNKTILFPIEN